MRVDEKSERVAAVAVLSQMIARWTERGEVHATAIPGLNLFRRTEPGETLRGQTLVKRGWI